MKWITRYCCVKKVCRIAGVAVVAVFVFSLLIWNINSESHRMYEGDPSMQNIIQQVQARRNPDSTLSLNDTSSNIATKNVSIKTGFDRAHRVTEMCKFMKERVCQNNVLRGPYCNTASKVRVDYIKHPKAMFCPMCKMASTFWTRVFRMISKNDVTGQSNQLKTPYDVPISDAPASTFHYDTHSNLVLHGLRADFKFMFVRDPFVMLFSTYVDKIIGPNPVYWKEFGLEATARLRNERSQVCGADVTFEEFINHVTHRFKINRPLDCHFAKYSTCNPCGVNYDFIGKMETFKDDTFDILTVLNQNNTVTVLKDEFSHLHAEDAIEDSVSGPFGWKADIVKCISWHEALKRIWRKLQIRGILGPTPFPLSPEDSEKISKEGFIALANAKWNESASLDRSALKEQAYLDAYKSVSADAIEGIKNVYKEEFEIFDYNTIPLTQPSYTHEHPLSKINLFDLSNL